MYCIFDTQHEPHRLPISKSRTWESRTIETCRTPPTTRDNETTTSPDQRKCVRSSTGCLQNMGGRRGSIPSRECRRKPCSVRLLSTRRPCARRWLPSVTVRHRAAVAGAGTCRSVHAPMATASSAVDASSVISLVCRRLSHAPSRS